MPWLWPTVRRRNTPCWVSSLVLLLGSAGCITEPTNGRTSRNSSLSQRAFLEGLELSRAGQHAEAVTRYEVAIAADSGHGLAHLEQAESNLFMGKDPLTLEPVLARAVELMPQNPRAHMRYAEVLADIGRPGDAEEHWRRALVLKPELIDPRLQLAALLERGGELHAARSELERAVIIQPRDVRARMRLGELLEGQRRFEDAALHVEIAADAARSAPLYRRAAALYESAGRLRLADELRARADRIDPPAETRKLRPLPKARKKKGRKKRRRKKRRPRR